MRKFIMSDKRKNSNDRRIERDAFYIDMLFDKCYKHIETLTDDNLWTMCNVIDSINYGTKNCICTESHILEPIKVLFTSNEWWRIRTGKVEQYNEKTAIQHIPKLIKKLRFIWKIIIQVQNERQHYGITIN